MVWITLQEQSSRKAKLGESPTYIHQGGVKRKAILHLVQDVWEWSPPLPNKQQGSIPRNGTEPKVLLMSSSSPASRGNPARSKPDGNSLAFSLHTIIPAFHLFLSGNLPILKIQPKELTRTSSIINLVSIWRVRGRQGKEDEERQQQRLHDIPSWKPLIFAKADLPAMLWLTIDSQHFCSNWSYGREGPGVGWEKAIICEIIRWQTSGKARACIHFFSNIPRREHECIWWPWTSIFRFQIGDRFWREAFSPGGLW